MNASMIGRVIQLADGLISGCECCEWLSGWVEGRVTKFMFDTDYTG